jgi:hypothetical protein
MKPMLAEAKTALTEAVGVKVHLHMHFMLITMQS